MFNDLQQGPFDEFKTYEVQNAFEKALSTESEIAVVATMSSGKSTLINAILGYELMPSQNMACTACITRIRHNPELSSYRARAMDEKGNMLQDWREADLQQIDTLNKRSDISIIEIEGPISGISSSQQNLVLIDTPGPNNFLNKTHREKTIRFIKSEQRPLILYILNATQLGVNDDALLIDTVAESIREDDKQLSDRIIFALNRLDNFNPDREDIGQVMENAREYLREKGIRNPNVYPVSALIAKLLRLKSRNQDIGINEFEIMKFGANVRKFDSLHLMQYAPLTGSNRIKLEQEASHSNGEKHLLYQTGVPAVEKGIEEYLEKYAVPDKFFTAVESFRAILDNKDWDAGLRIGIAENEKLSKSVEQAMSHMKEILNRGDQRKQFDERIAKLHYDNSTIKKIRRKLPKLISAVIASFLENQNLNATEARMYLEDAEKKITYFESEIKVELENLFINGLFEEAKKLLQEYITFFREMFESNRGINYDIKEDLLKGFTITLPDPQSLMESTIVRKYEMQYDYVKRSIFNINRWMGDEYKKTKVGYKEVDRIDINNLVDSFTSLVKQNFYKNITTTEQLLEKEFFKLKEAFMEMRNEFEYKLRAKIKEYQRIAGKKEEIKDEIVLFRQKRVWLHDISDRLSNILDI
ncbi:MAG: dynamin family protein [Candidatus Cloacimonetes bacterium]|nr:dynamin family protein [Candidatus Cloacimonadota bacterium]